MLLVVLGGDRVERLWSATGCCRWRPSGDRVEKMWSTIVVKAIGELCSRSSGS